MDFEELLEAVRAATPAQKRQIRKILRRGEQALRQLAIQGG